MGEKNGDRPMSRREKQGKGHVAGAVCFVADSTVASRKQLNGYILLSAFILRNSHFVLVIQNQFVW